MMQQTAEDTLPFGPEFQQSLLHMLFDDSGFSRQVAPHVKPHYFDNHVHSWVWQWSQWYAAQYGAMPSYMALHDAIRQNVAAESAPVYGAIVEKIREERLKDSDESYLRDQVVDFVRRQHFKRLWTDARDLHNAGAEGVYDLVMSGMEELMSIDTQTSDTRQWWAEEFTDRWVARQDRGTEDRIGTGIPELDRTLGGGIDVGFLGVWLARAKAGKSTFLANLGAVAMRAYSKRVLHIPLEGSGSYIADRYDTIFTDDVYSAVRRGEADPRKFAIAAEEMKRLRSLMVIKAFTDEWAYNITHIWNEMKELKSNYGWEPDLIIVDYCDLLDSRTPQKSTTEAQKHSFQDLKTLANRGYRVWTASQVQRPRDKDFDEAQDVLKSRDIADCYAKVRIADLVGSINQTRAEREQNVMRLFLELGRDVPTGHTFLVHSDFEKMRIGGPQEVQPLETLVHGGTAGTVKAAPPLGYGLQQQRF